MRETKYYKIYTAVFTIAFFLHFSVECFAQNSHQNLNAGLRSSVYGINPFPDTTWWYNVASDMAGKFDEASPAVIWILGYTTNDGCYLGFPNPNPGTTYNKIFFSSTDKNERFLDAFDNSGVKVWLQVEPGQADILTVIELVFQKYGHHSCIMGFGIDVEWYKENERPGWGVPVKDSEAELWEQKVKSFNPNHKLFLKHWDRDWMPPGYRGEICFISDSQGFSNLSGMLNEFSDYWADYFNPAKVGFQFGYPNDKTWWSKLNDPPGDIGKDLLDRCTNISDLYWVDFTAYDIWPKDFDPTSVSADIKVPEDFMLYQNYPNPFNPSTNAGFSLDKTSNVNLFVCDVLGRIVKNIISGQTIPKGYHNYNINLTEQTSGIYFLVLSVGDKRKFTKMILLK